GQVVFAGSIEQMLERAPAAVHVLRTSNDAAALSMASCRRDLKVWNAGEGGLEVTADVDALDAYVIALAGAGIALRSMERRTRSLDSLFLELTGAETPEPRRTAVQADEPAESVAS